jgi:hypothetical protein
MGLSILNRIGKVIDHNIDKFIELVLETRKDFNQKALLYNASGEDSPPIKNDRIILLHIDGTGKYIAAGVLTESQGAKPGEKIFFARDLDGKIISKIKMLDDGSINIEADGDITLKTKKNNIHEVEGNLNVTIKGDVEFEANGKIKENGGKDIIKEAAGKYTIKGATIEISGSTELVLKTIGASLWCPNSVTNCFFCGAPHGGPAMGIVGLKGAS